MNVISTPYCEGLQECPSAANERARLSAVIRENGSFSDPLSIYLSYGLAYTVGSALGYTPPDTETCLAAFTSPNSVGLYAGSRAWSKHFHRSMNSPSNDTKNVTSAGWWGKPFGPVSVINEKALTLFWKFMSAASWRNLHWLPHQILVYEVRIPEGYGMRWFQDRGASEDAPWTFRGFVEPMMENGHEVGWRH